jgi:hypothetical protein
MSLKIGYLLARIFLKSDVHRRESRERSLSRFPNVSNEIVFLRIPAVAVSTHEFVQFRLHPSLSFPQLQPDHRHPANRRHPRALIPRGEGSIRDDSEKNFSNRSFDSSFQTSSHDWRR